jgi:hypothetical protein
MERVIYALKTLRVLNAMVWKSITLVVLITSERSGRN